MCAKDSRGHYLRRVLIDMMTVACYMRNGYIIAEKKYSEKIWFCVNLGGKFLSHYLTNKLIINTLVN